jgi:hypothetical protein
MPADQRIGNVVTDVGFTRYRRILKCANRKHPICEAFRKAYAPMLESRTAHFSGMENDGDKHADGAQTKSQRHSR